MDVILVLNLLCTLAALISVAQSKAISAEVLKEIKEAENNDRERRSRIQSIISKKKPDYDADTVEIYNLNGNFVAFRPAHHADVAEYEKLGYFIKPRYETNSGGEAR